MTAQGNNDFFERVSRACRPEDTIKIVSRYAMVCDMSKAMIQDGRGAVTCVLAQPLNQRRGP